MDQAGGGVREWGKGVGILEDGQRSAGDRGRREAVGCRGRWDLVSVSPRPVTASSPLRAILLPMFPGGGEESRDRRTRFLERRADRAGVCGQDSPLLLALCSCAKEQLVLASPALSGAARGVIPDETSRRVLLLFLSLLTLSLTGRRRRNKCSLDFIQNPSLLEKAVLRGR